MKEEIMIKITEKEAINKIIKKLRNRKIICQLGTGYKDDIENQNFDMEINSGLYYNTWSTKEKEYEIINIQISTKEYPHTRRRLNKFNVDTGNYDELIEKIKLIIREDIKKKQELEVKIKTQNSNLELLKEKIKGLGAKKEQYGEGYVFKNKYFIVTFDAFEDKIGVDIKENEDLSIDQAIELIKKLQ
jgi:hypothetical protein